MFFPMFLALTTENFWNSEVSHVLLHVYLGRLRKSEQSATPKILYGPESWESHDHSELKKLYFRGGGKKVMVVWNGLGIV